MRTGAVALIDALGFRGIWTRYPAQKVMAHMREMQAWFDTRVRGQFKTQPSIECELAFLSDTIAVAYSGPAATDEERLAVCAQSIGDVVSWLLDWSLRTSEVSLAYRGAIAVGEYDMSSHFLIGPAIDDAASAYELAEGAFVWLTPKARRHVVSRLRTQPKNTHLVRFDVPLKGGDTLETYTVSPIMHSSGESDADAQAATLLRTFSDSSISIEIKRQNTLRHLQACYKWRGFAFPRELEDGERASSGP